MISSRRSIDTLNSLSPVVGELINAKRTMHSIPRYARIGSTYEIFTVLPNIFHLIFNLNIYFLPKWYNRTCANSEIHS
jgi:hypothetical protein